MVLVGPFARLSFIPVNILCYMAWQVNWSQERLKRLLKNTVAADIRCPRWMVFLSLFGAKTYKILFHHTGKMSTSVTA